MRRIVFSLLVFLSPIWILGAQLNINIGTTANDNTGDTLRSFAGKAQTNFTELYSNLTTVSNLAAAGGGSGKLTASSNLLDVASIPTARANLGAEKKRTFNILDYGADSSGVVASTLPLANALTAASAVNGIVYIPEGTYLIAPSTISVGSVKIEGRGTLKAASIGTNLFSWTGSNVSIDGITVDGDDKVIKLFNVGAYSTNWIVKNAVFKNARVTDSNDSGNTVINSGQRTAAFRLNNGNQFFEFSKCKFLRFAYDGDKVSYLGGSGRCSSAIHAAPFPAATNTTEAILHLSVLDCEFYNEAEATFKFDADALVFQNQDYDLIPRSDILVRGCKFVNWYWRDGKMQLSGGQWLNNWQYSPTTAPASTGPTKRAGVEWFGHNWIVSNNHIYGGSIEHPINAFGYFTQPTNSIVTGNEIELSTAGGAASYGIWMKSPDGFTITGNIIRNCYEGIRIQGYAKNWASTGNVITGSTDGQIVLAESDLTDPYASKAASVGTLNGNIYNNCSNYGEWVSAGTNINQVGATGSGTVALANRTSGITGEVGLIYGYPRSPLETVSPFQIDSTSGGKYLRIEVTNSATDTITFYDNSANLFARWDGIALRYQIGNTAGEVVSLGDFRTVKQKTTYATVTYNASQTIDLSAGESQNLTQAGSMTISFSNAATGRRVRLNITGDGSAITWPSCKPIGKSALPTSITSGKVALFDLECPDTTASNTRVVYLGTQDADLFATGGAVDQLTYNAVALSSATPSLSWNTNKYIQRITADTTFSFANTPTDTNTVKTLDYWVIGDGTHVLTNSANTISFEPTFPAIVPTGTNLIRFTWTGGLIHADVTWKQNATDGLVAQVNGTTTNIVLNPTASLSGNTFTPMKAEEVDGSPSVAVYKIKFPNSTLTDNGDGTATYTPAAGGAVDDTAFASSWNGVTGTAPSKNAVYDWAHTFDTDDDGKVDVLDNISSAGIPKVNSSGAVTGNAGNAELDILQQVAAASLASASTTDLGAQTSQKVSVTGTTTITSFGTVAAGTVRWVTFTGALTLTHNATSLILPNAGSNITTAAGDSLLAISLGSGNWKVYFYQKADGTALVGGAGGGTAVYVGSTSVSNPSFQSDQFAINTSTNIVLKSAATITNVVNVGKVTLTDAATIATDASLGNSFQVTLGGNRTLGNPTNGKNGQKCIWELIQDGTGSRTITMDTKFAFGTDITGITLTTTASKRDFITAQYDSTADKWYVVGFVRGY